MKKTGKAYYMISAVAQKYNIHPQTLRLYEREGLLKPSRTEGNTRLYSEEDLEQLETILTLTRDLGVNLAGVEVILNMRRKIQQMQGEVNEFMEYVKRELARGIDDWEQRLSTALVKSTSTDLVRVESAAAHHRGAKKTRALKKLRAIMCPCFRRRKTRPVCSLCNGTGWKAFQEGDVERVTRCDCWRDDISQAPHRRSAHSAAIPSLHAERLRHLRQRYAGRCAAAGHGGWPRSFRSSSAGCFSSAILALARRISPSRF